jgi:hypothetical protein
MCVLVDSILRVVHLTARGCSTLGAFGEGSQKAQGLTFQACLKGSQTHSSDLFLILPMRTQLNQSCYHQSAFV